jgi:hypothetical protein
MRILLYKKQSKINKHNISNNCKDKSNKPDKENKLKKIKYKRSNYRGRGSFMINLKLRLKSKIIKMERSSKMDIL